jgi:hypothetical protein
VSGSFLKPVDYLCMDGCQVGVLKEPNKVGLRRLLEGKDCIALEPQIGLEVLSNLPARRGLTSTPSLSHKPIFLKLRLAAHEQITNII